MSVAPPIRVFVGARAADQPPFARASLVQPAELAAAQPDQLVQVLLDGAREPVSVARKDVFLCSPIEGNAGVPDNTQLFYLDEANLLHNITCRFEAEEIYTYTGTVLLAVNPYRKIGRLYDEETMDLYRGRPLGVMPPHVYGIAERARRMLIAEQTDQSIIVSGESGAGKTESCRAVVQYLAYHARHEAGELSSAILAANPVLEAFGCAVTSRNRNSSRFGKLMEIWTSRDSSVLSGSSIVTYLLEKGRVSHHAQGDRNFHIFYYLLAAASALADGVGGSQWEIYARLRTRMAEGGGVHALSYLADGPNKTDEAERSSWVDGLRGVARAFSSIGASIDELAGVWRALAAVTTLGELRFSSEAAADDKALLAEESEPDVQELARMLAVDRDILVARLTSKTVVSGRGSTYVIRYSVEQAVGCRDGLAHELYGRLFSWIVRVVNRSLGSGAASGRRSISILDIFGFENLSFNSLEQLLINHTNERLQLFFLHETVIAELTLYRAEGVRAPTIECEDNAPCVELVGGRPLGIVWQLEDECALPKANDTNLVERLQSTFSGHGNFAPPGRIARRGALAPRFAVAHFAGVVEYESEGFVHKNSDALHPDLPALLSASANALVAELFAAELTDEPDSDPPPGTKPGSRRGSRGGSGTRSGGRGLAGSFARQLEALMLSLSRTTPHYIRCIKPNALQQSGSLEPHLVLEQLRYGGTPQLLELMAKGFPTRCDYDMLARRYRALLPQLDSARLSNRDFVHALLTALGLREAHGDAAGGEFALGVRLAFFSVGAMGTLDALVHGSEAQTSELVDRVHAYLRRRRWQQAAGATVAVLYLGRRIAARRRLTNVVAFACARPRAAAWKLRAVAQIRGKAAASLISAVARGCFARKHVAAKKGRVAVLQAAARAMLARHNARQRRAARAVVAIQLQRLARGRQSRLMHADLRVARRAATILQAATRRRAAVRQLHELRQAAAAKRAHARALMRARLEAATTVQCNWRWRMALRELQMLRDEASARRAAAAAARREARACRAAVMMIQAAARRFAARRTLLRLREASARANQREARRLAALARSSAAITLQAAARRRAVTRRATFEVTTHSAAKCVQAHWRAHERRRRECAARESEAKALAAERLAAEKTVALEEAFSDMEGLVKQMGHDHEKERARLENQLRAQLEEERRAYSAQLEEKEAELREARAQLAVLRPSAPRPAASARDSPPLISIDLTPIKKPEGTPARTPHSAARRVFSAASRAVRSVGRSLIIHAPPPASPPPPALQLSEYTPTSIRDPPPASRLPRPVAAAAPVRRPSVTTARRESLIPTKAASSTSRRESLIPMGIVQKRSNSGRRDSLIPKPTRASIEPPPPSDDVARAQNLMPRGQTSRTSVDGKENGPPVHSKEATSEELVQPWMRDVLTLRC